jgi:hypothetical protein
MVCIMYGVSWSSSSSSYHARMCRWAVTAAAPPASEVSIQRVDGDRVQHTDGHTRSTYSYLAAGPTLLDLTSWQQEDGQMDGASGLPAWPCIMPPQPNILQLTCAWNEHVLANRKPTSILIAEGVYTHDVIVHVGRACLHAFSLQTLTRCFFPYTDILNYKMVYLSRYFFNKRYTIQSLYPH